MAQQVVKYIAKWKVFAVSSNRNSFGLRSMLVMNQTGEVWRILANDLNVREKDSIIDTVVVQDEAGQYAPEYMFAGYECPERQKDAPEELIKEVWGEPLDV